MERLESTYNRSMKIMLGLPWGTHRNLIEPLTGMPHMRRTLIKRYLSFIRKIRDSSKQALASLLGVVKNDSRTLTGSNLRHIMLLAGKDNIEEVFDNIDVEYYTLPGDLSWKVEMIKELIDVLHGEKEVSEFEKTELEKILEHLCVD